LTLIYNMSSNAGSSGIIVAYLSSQLIFAIFFLVTAGISFVLFFVFYRKNSSGQMTTTTIMHGSQFFFCVFQIISLILGEVIVWLLNLELFINLALRAIFFIVSTCFLLVTIALVVLMWAKRKKFENQTISRALPHLFIWVILVVLFICIIYLIAYGIGMIIASDLNFQTFHYVFLAVFGLSVFIYILAAVTCLILFTHSIVTKDMYKGAEYSSVPQQDQHHPQDATPQNNTGALGDSDSIIVSSTIDEKAIKKGAKKTKILFIFQTFLLSIVLIAIGIEYILPSICYLILNYVPSATQDTFDWSDWVVSNTRLLTFLTYCVIVTLVFHKDNEAKPLSMTEIPAEPSEEPVITVELKDNSDDPMKPSNANAEEISMDIKEEFKVDFDNSQKLAALVGNHFTNGVNL